MQRQLASLAAMFGLLFAPIAAAKESPPRMSAMNFIKNRASRSIVILVPQNGLEAEFALSHLAQEDPLVRYGFGLSGLLVQGIGTSNNRKKSEKAVIPIRTATKGFELDALTERTFVAALQKVDWLAGSPISFSKAASPTDLNKIVDAAGTDQVVFIRVGYAMNNGFDSLQLIETIEVASRAMPLTSKAKDPGTVRLQPQNLAYFAALRVEVAMRKQAYQPIEENAKLWAANDGAAAKQAMNQAVIAAAALTVRTLQLSDQDIVNLANPMRLNYPYRGRSARIIESDTRHYLLWLDQFIAIDWLK